MGFPENPVDGEVSSLSFFVTRLGEVSFFIGCFDPTAVPGLLQKGEDMLLALALVLPERLSLLQLGEDILRCHQGVAGRQLSMQIVVDLVHRNLFCLPFLGLGEQAAKHGHDVVQRQAQRRLEDHGQGMTADQSLEMKEFHDLLIDFFD